MFRRKEDDVKRERDSLREKGKRADFMEYVGNPEKTEKGTKEDKRDDVSKKDRIRNKVLVLVVVVFNVFIQFLLAVHLRQTIDNASLLP